MAELEIHAASMLGWLFVSAVIGGGAGYVAGGAAYGQRTGGAPGLAGHPHHAKWVELYGLCSDGLAFAQSRGRGRAGGGYQPVRAPKSGGGGGEPKGSKEKSSSDTSRGSPSPKKKEKKEKKERAEKKGGQKERASRALAATGVATPAAAAPAPAVAAATPAAGTSAGDGGRWVHVPN